MTRDRMAELRANIPEDDGVVIMMAGANHMNDSLQHFNEDVERVANHLTELERIVEEMDKLHASILAAPKADEVLKEQLESLMSQCKRYAGKVRTKVKDLEQLVERAKERKGPNSAEYRIRRNQHTMLLKRLSDLMSSYNTVQEEYRKRCKARIQRQLEITGSAISEDKLEEMLESGNPAIFTEGIVINNQKALESLQEIEARHRDIIKLEKNILELHDLFLEMAQLVEHQGEMIDVIQHQVEQTKDFVLTGNEQIVEALRNKASATRKKLLCYSILIVILILLFFTFFWDLIKR